MQQFEWLCTAIPCSYHEKKHQSEQSEQSLSLSFPFFPFCLKDSIPIGRLTIANFWGVHRVGSGLHLHFGHICGGAARCGKHVVDFQLCHIIIVNQPINQLIHYHVV